MMNFNGQDLFHRREILEKVGSGFGMMSLAGMLASAEGASQKTPQQTPHFASKAKRDSVLLQRIFGLRLKQWA